MYFDAVDDRSHLSTRIGRQTKFGGGILGRFDGIQAGLQVKANLKINVAAGYPVYSSRQARIDNSRAFGSISVDWSAADDKWQASIYALNQRSSGITDRRSIGREVRFRSKAVGGRALIDYDIVFRKLNAALLTLSANMVDGSNLSVAAEYIHYPTLSAINAVLGQPTSSLRVLQGGFDKQTIYRLAIDRALVSRAITLNYSRAPNKQWQVIADATISSVHGSPASAGVDAIIGTGTKAFFGVQAVGTAIVKPSDS